jgi:hypothetical protein
VVVLEGRWLGWQWQCGSLIAGSDAAVGGLCLQVVELRMIVVEKGLG